MKHRTMGALGLATVILAGCTYNPTILGREIDRQAVCPGAGKYCAQSIGNAGVRTLTKEPRYLTNKADNTPDYWGLLGREFTPEGTQIVNFCGNEAVNPLQAYAEANDVDILITDAATNTFDFSRQVRSMRSFAAEIDVDALLTAAAIPTGAGRVQAEAALRAALSRVDETQLAMRGRYSFVYIRPATLALLKANTIPVELQACSEALRSGSRPIISSLTMVAIDTLTNSGTLKSNATGGLDAALNDALTSTQLASLKANFETAIDQVYSNEFGRTYQVLSIGGYDGR